VNRGVSAANGRFEEVSVSLKFRCQQSGAKRFEKSLDPFNGLGVSSAGEQSA
jgi:hypothetical protein